MTVDNHVGSPFQDRVYVTWTTVRRRRHGVHLRGLVERLCASTFSAPVLVSRTARCAGTPSASRRRRAAATRTSSRSRSRAATASSTSSWANFNNVVTGADNRNQMLLAKSTDGGADVRRTGQGRRLLRPARLRHVPGRGDDPGRACVPGEGADVAFDLPGDELSVGRRQPERIPRRSWSPTARTSTRARRSRTAAHRPVLGDAGINQYTGVKTSGACNNKILLSVSSNAGASFTGGAAGADPRTQTTVNVPHQAGSDQWWQWAAFNKRREARGLLLRPAVRRRRDDRVTRTSASPARATFRRFGVKRVTRSSMPPPTQFSGTFFGDYTGLDAFDDAHPIWADTRSPDLFLCPGTGTPGHPPDVCTGTESGRTAGWPDGQRRGHLHCGRRGPDEVAEIAFRGGRPRPPRTSADAGGRGRRACRRSRIDGDRTTVARSLTDLGGIWHASEIEPPL